MVLADVVPQAPWSEEWLVAYFAGDDVVCIVSGRVIGVVVILQYMAVERISRSKIIMAGDAFQLVIFGKIQDCSTFLCGG